jgi:hypothetical protein
VPIPPYKHQRLSTHGRCIVPRHRRRKLRERFSDADASVPSANTDTDGDDDHDADDDHNHDHDHDAEGSGGDDHDADDEAVPFAYAHPCADDESRVIDGPCASVGSMRWYPMAGAHAVRGRLRVRGAE